jgi:acetyl-CoA acetyltransferase
VHSLGAIIGVADRVPPKGTPTDYWELHTDLAREAVADAGISPRDIDGVVFTRSGYPMGGREVFPTTFCEQLGIQPAWVETVPHGGAQMSSMLWRAASGIRNGFASTVLIVAADNRESRLSRGGVVTRIAEQNMDVEFEVPYGPIFATNFSLMARRHMHEYGTTSEQFAHVAMIERRHAQLTEQARMQASLTVEDVLASRMVSSPLHLLDICLITDGGGVAVMVSPDRATDRANPPVHLVGVGDCTESQSITVLSDLVRPELMQRATEQAFGTARIGPADVDLAFPYDPATSYFLWGLEQMGFCKPGEAASFVADGQTALGGSLPCNTHGGLLSYGHPGIAGAFLGIIEAVRQLRGAGGARQVRDAGVAVTSCMGGFLAAGVNVLASDDAL